MKTIGQQLQRAKLNCQIANGAALASHLHWWRMDLPEGSAERVDVERRLARAIDRLEALGRLRESLSNPCPTKTLQPISPS